MFNVFTSSGEASIVSFFKEILHVSDSWRRVKKAF